MEPTVSISVDDLVDETRRIWNHKAEFWDDRMGEGNAFTLELVGPSVERLLAVQPDEVVLEVGCGNGVISRRLARLGARVIATDFSERFLELAAARSADLGDRITYNLIDATDEEHLLSLGAGRFDAVVSTMAMMDMPVIEPLLRATRRLLAPGGRFVFSLQHPAFNSNAIGLCSETVVLPTGEDVTRFYIRVNNYLDVPAGRAGGMVGEPEPHWYFHRPLHELLGICFAAGFVLDGLEEPGFVSDAGAQRIFSWRNFIGIPPVLTIRVIPRG